MKALSIRQPWAHAILHLGKRVENRDWSGCSYRGPVLLHASSRIVLRPTKRDRETFGDAVESILEITRPEPGPVRSKLLESFAVLTTGRAHDPETCHARRGCGEPIWRPAPTLPLGGIVGRARIVGAVQRGHDHVVKPPPGACVCSSPWYAGGFALALADVEPLPFIQWKGSLGFFDVPDVAVQRAIAEASVYCPCGSAACKGCVTG